MKKQVFVQTFGWPLFRECDTGLPGAGRGVASVLVFLSLFLAVGEVFACSANLIDTRSMVRESDAVVLAEVTGVAQPDHIKLRTLDILKGSLQDRVWAVRGRLEEYPAATTRAVPYTELDCMRANLCGGCFAEAYKQGHQYLFFLKNGDPYWAPLAPANEEISGPDDPWVLWVKRTLIEQEEKEGVAPLK